MPLACSIAIRLVSAFCNRSSRRAGARASSSWTIAMLAVSASARANAMSCSVSRAASAVNRFKQPRMRSRSRNGIANTARYPKERDSRAKLGQRPRSGSARSLAPMTDPLRKHSRHGPSSFWIWNSSSKPTSSVEAAITRRSPRSSASKIPAAVTSSRSTQRMASTVSRSITSKSSTNVSISSTNAKAVRVCLFCVRHVASPNPSCPATMSRATSFKSRPLLNAKARMRRRASSAVMPAWTAAMPEAW
ncbi:MAG: hypothetical protein JWN62_4315 [Acidimicrobiales bacterium]|nr:hypothetical protein [Acidimicrobiales bacterium]